MKTIIEIRVGGAIKEHSMPDAVADFITGAMKTSSYSGRAPTLTAVIDSLPDELREQITTKEISVPKLRYAEPRGAFVDEMLELNESAEQLLDRLESSKALQTRPTGTWGGVNFKETKL